MRAYIVVFSALGALLLGCSDVGGITLHVSPSGNNAFSGRSPLPNADRTDGVHTDYYGRGSREDR